jgi:hypothetical protein
MSFLKTSVGEIKRKAAEERKRVATRGPLFTVVRKGMDVLINRPIGGHWEGYTFSELRDDYEGRKILGWVTRGDFDRQIVEIAADMLDI